MELAKEKPFRFWSRSKLKGRIKYKPTSSNDREVNHTTTINIIHLENSLQW